MFKNILNVYIQSFYSKLYYLYIYILTKSYDLLSRKMKN